MDHPLDGSRAKVERGRAHLRTLYEELKPSFDSPLRFDRRWLDPVRGPDGQPYPVLEVFISEVTSVPLASATILGDALHNFRSALDHLAWQLVIRSGGFPTKQTQFPLAASPKKFSDRKARVAGMTRAIATEIEQLQPYGDRGGPTHRALRHLRDLSNKDKHQVLNVVLMGLGELGHDIRLVDCAARGAWINPNVADRPLAAGIPVARFYIVDQGPNPDVRFEMEYGAYAALAETVERESLEHTTVRIAMCVEGIVERFARLFFV